MVETKWIDPEDVTMSAQRKIAAIVAKAMPEVWVVLEPVGWTPSSHVLEFQVFDRDASVKFATVGAEIVVTDARDIQFIDALAIVVEEGL